MIKSVAAPAIDAVRIPDTHVSELRQAIQSIEMFQRYDPINEQTKQLRAVRRAVGEWEQWATGKAMTPARVVAAIAGLRSDTVSEWPECGALADVLQQWAAPRGIVPTPTLAPPSRPGPSLGVEL